MSGYFHPYGIMLPSQNTTAVIKRSTATAGPLNNEPILPLPHKIYDEGNRIWYKAKLKYKLVVQCTVENLLESQVGILPRFRALQWNSLAKMKGE